MNIFHSLTFIIFLSLQDGDAVFVFTAVKGGDVTVLCPVRSPGTEKFFCRGDCEEEEDILIETSAPRAQSGRYSISSDKAGIIDVTITQLLGSDSGVYRCGAGAPHSSVTYTQVEIFTVDAMLNESYNPSKVKALDTKTGGNVTVRCSFNFRGSRKFFCRDRCEEKDILAENRHGDTAQSGRHTIKYLGFPANGYLYVTITQLTPADSGRYWCGVDTSYLGFDIRVTEDSTMLYAGAPLLFTALLVPVAVLIFCRWRAWKPKGLKTRGKRRGQNSQVTLYENDPPPSKGGDSVYLSLHPATRDLDQTYSTLTHH